MNPISYDSWLATDSSQEEKAVAECENCGAELFANQDVIEDINGGYFYCDTTCFADDCYEKSIIAFKTLEVNV